MDGLADGEAEGTPTGALDGLAEGVGVGLKVRNGKSKLRKELMPIPPPMPMPPPIPLRICRRLDLFEFSDVAPLAAVSGW